MQLSSKGLQPAMSLSFGNQLSKNFVGYLTYSTNWRVHESNDVGVPGNRNLLKHFFSHARPPQALELSEEESGVSTMLVYNTER